jgi:hypothetical protein|tara:strand:+ start:394 stop:591 length:198 start_codon:yes stop_codon:yes gene_type:complete
MDGFTDRELTVLQNAAFRQVEELINATRLPLVDVDALKYEAAMLQSVGRRIQEERARRIEGRHSS